MGRPLLKTLLIPRTDIVGDSFYRITESGSTVAIRHEGTIVVTVYGTTVRKKSVANCPTSRSGDSLNSGRERPPLEHGGTGRTMPEYKGISQENPPQE